MIYNIFKFLAESRTFEGKPAEYGDADVKCVAFKCKSVLDFVNSASKAILYAGGTQEDQCKLLMLLREAEELDSDKDYALTIFSDSFPVRGLSDKDKVTLLFPDYPRSNFFTEETHCYEDEDDYEVQKNRCR